MTDDTSTPTASHEADAHLEEARRALGRARGAQTLDEKIALCDTAQGFAANAALALRRMRSRQSDDAREAMIEALSAGTGHEEYQR